MYENRVYLNNNKSWHQEDSRYKANIVLKTLRKNRINFKSCLDIGCGAGLTTEILAKRYKHSSFHGTDISNDAAGFWQMRENLDNLSYSHDTEIDSRARYDLVLCLDVMEHVEDYFGFLREIQKLGNSYIFNIPLDMNVLKILTNGIKYVREEVGHLHYFNKYSALTSLRDCGYQIEHDFISAAFLKVPPRNFRQAAILPFRLISMFLGTTLSTKVFGGHSLVVYASPINVGASQEISE